MDLASSTDPVLTRTTRLSSESKFYTSFIGSRVKAPLHSMSYCIARPPVGDLDMIHANFEQPRPNFAVGTLENGLLFLRTGQPEGPRNGRFMS